MPSLHRFGPWTCFSLLVAGAVWFSSIQPGTTRKAAEISRSLVGDKDIPPTPAAIGDSSADVPPPKGLDRNAWSRIQDLIQESRYAVRQAREEDALWAGNPAQHFNTTFRPDGIHIEFREKRKPRPAASDVGIRSASRKVTWEVELSTQSIGRGDYNPPRAVGVIQSQGRVEYRYPGVTEWYENRPEGLEQGYTLDRRPAGTGKLRVDILLAGDLEAHERIPGRELSLRDSTGETRAYYKNLFALDATGKDLPARIELASANKITLVVDDAGAAYPVLIDPLVTTEGPTLLAGDGAPSDQFGKSVAIDGNTVVVGAYLDDLGAETNAGSAYVYSRNEGGPNSWGQARKLVASDGTGQDNFGSAVAVDGDTVVVGASQHGIGGAAYVFSRNVGGVNNWGEVKKLVASDVAPSDKFGDVLEIDGDIVVVAAINNDAGGDNAGAAYVFSRNAGGTNNWGEVKKILASDSAGGDQFGSSVSVHGGTIVVGSYFDDHALGVAAGSAYVFSRDEGGNDNWGEVAQLAASDGNAGDIFGSAVAIEGDTIVVGSEGDSFDGKTAAGSAYVFGRNSGGSNAWGEVAKVVASDAADQDHLGTYVALDGDMIAVGTHQADTPGGIDAGATYIYSRNQGGNGNWGQVLKLVAADGEPQDRFGNVAIDGNTVVVGAKDDDTAGGVNSGSVRIFTVGSDSLVNTATLQASDSTSGDLFGRAVAVDGDTLVVGAYSNDTAAGEDAGSAYVFSRDQGGADNWGQVKQLLSGNPQANAEFGFSVAADGDTIVVGARFDNFAVTAAGAAYVYGRDQGGAGNWGQVAQLLASDSEAAARFGSAVMIDGDAVVVGAPTNDTAAGGDAGSAYVFLRNEGGANNWGEVKLLVASDAAETDRFGSAVAVDGDTVVVGAPLDDTAGGAVAGSAYVFSRDDGGVSNWGQVTQLLASDGEANDQFGSTVSVDGDIIVVGAHEDDTAAGLNAGSAYVFSRDQGGANSWGEVTQLLASDGAISDLFGSSVEVEGDVIAVGAYADDHAGGNNAGSAYVFSRNEGGGNAWGEIARLDNGLDSAGLGYNVALDGDTLVAGSSTGEVATVFRHDFTPDLTPDAFSFTDQFDVARSSTVTSNTITITGITASAPINVDGGSYSIGCSTTFTTDAGTIENDETVCVRHTASSSFEGHTETTLTIGGVEDTFSSTTEAQDVTPDAFVFTDQVDVEPGSTSTSNTITISGINDAASISVADGSYSVGCTATFVTTAGTIDNGQSVCVRHTASFSFSTATDTTLMVGGVSDIFSSTTRSEDATPNPFSFTDQTGVGLSATITSNTLTITGLTDPAPISVTGGSYSIGCTGTFTGVAGTIENNQAVCLRHVASSSFSTDTNTTLTIGGVSDTFTSTTQDAPPADTTPDAFSFPRLTGVATNSVVTSATASVSGINAPAPISINVGELRVNAGSFVAAPADGQVNNGDVITVRHTSASGTLSSTSTVVNIGGVTGTFTTTTTRNADGSAGDTAQVDDANQEPVSVSSNAGSIERVARAPAPPAPPANLDFPNGFFSLSLTGMNPGSSPTTTFVLPEGSSPTDFVTCTESGSCDKSLTTSVSGNTVTLSITDGSPDDLDGAVNGSIEVLGAPAVGLVTSGGGGGGALGLSSLLALLGLALAGRRHGRMRR